MVVAGEAVTVAPVVADNPVEGLQEYDVAPLAVRLVEDPTQIGFPPETLIIRWGVTVMIVLMVSVQAPLVAVTIYLVVEVGLATTVEPLLTERLVAGDQE